MAADCAIGSEPRQREFSSDGPQMTQTKPPMKSDQRHDFKIHLSVPILISSAV